MHRSCPLSGIAGRRDGLRRESHVYLAGYHKNSVVRPLSEEAEVCTSMAESPVSRPGGGFLSRLRHARPRRERGMDRGMRGAARAVLAQAPAGRPARQTPEPDRAALAPRREAQTGPERTRARLVR